MTKKFKLSLFQCGEGHFGIYYDDFALNVFKILKPRAEKWQK